MHIGLLAPYWRANRGRHRHHDSQSRETGSTSASSNWARVAWLRAASGLVIAYVIASQALMDVPIWSASAFVLAALLSGLLAVGAYYQVRKIRCGFWVWLPLVFLCYCLLRCFSDVKDASPFDAFAQVSSAFLGGTALALALRAGVKFRAVIYAQVAANFLQIAIVLSGIGPAPPPGSEDTFRYAGLTGNPNALALQLTLGACLIWLVPRKSGVFACAFAVLSVAFAVAVTGSRKAVLLAFFFMILVLLQFVALVAAKWRRLTAVIAIATPCLTALCFGPWLFQHSLEITAVQRIVDYQDSSFQTRADMIQQGIRLWGQAPLFGNGLAAFEGLSDQGTYAHNNYVELLCDLGIVGTLMFYSLYGLLVVRASRASNYMKLYCWIFTLALLLTDVGYVSYKSKQAIMIVMILIVMTVSRQAVKHRRHTGNTRHKHQAPDLRRFVVRT